MARTLTTELPTMLVAAVVRVERLSSLRRMAARAGSCASERSSDERATLAWQAETCPTHAVQPPGNGQTPDPGGTRTLPGNLSSPPQYYLHGKLRPGPALRLPYPSQSAPVHLRRRALARLGNRRQYRHLHVGQSAHPPIAAGE